MPDAPGQERPSLKDLSYLFPHEIAARLEGIAAECGIDLQGDPGRPLPPERAEEALSFLLERLLLTPRARPLARLYIGLPKEYRLHLIHLLNASLARAREAERTAPQRMLGFPVRLRELVSVLLTGSWVDPADA